MILTLEVQAVAEPEVQVAAPPDVGVIHQGTRKVFEAGGGTIGRLPDNDFQLDDPFVSRKHCTIYIDGLCFTVSDLKSTNKTILNKKIIDAPQSFIDGDNLIIGKNLLKLNVDG